MEEKAPAHAGSRPHHTYFVLAGYLQSLAYSVWRRTGRPMGGHAQPQHYLQGQDPAGLHAKRGAAGHANSPAIAGCASGRCLVSRLANRSEEHTSDLQSLMRISYAVFCLKKT